MTERRSMFSPRSARCPSWITRSIRRRWASWARCAPGICAGAGLALATLQTVATLRLQASLASPSASVKVWQALRAEAIWPFDRRIRETAAHQALLDPGLPPAVVMLGLRAALAQAPDNPVLRAKLVLARLAVGDPIGARESALDFARRFPSLPEARQLLELTKGVRR